jgi:hypothetical protein
LNLQEITDQLKLIPDRAYKTGDVFIDEKYGAKKTVYQEDCWITGIKSEEGEPVEDTVARFLDKLRPYSIYLKELSSSCDVTLWLSLYPDNEQMNVHLSRKIIAQAYEMGISIDVGAMFLKQYYEGRY